MLDAKDTSTPLTNQALHWGTLPFVELKKYEKMLRSNKPPWQDFSTWHIPFLATSEGVSLWPPQLHFAALPGGCSWQAEIGLSLHCWRLVRWWGWVVGLCETPSAEASVSSRARGQERPSAPSACVSRCLSILVEAIASKQLEDGKAAVWVIQRLDMVLVWDWI